MSRIPLILCLLAVLSLGCDLDSSVRELANSVSEEIGRNDRSTEGRNASGTTHTTPASTVSSSRAIGNLRIAAFNIQVYGTSKAGKPGVMSVLADTIRQFDIVAIQEIRATDQTVLRQLVDLVNADGRQYDSVLGPRLGRTSSKEQYAYVFDTTRVMVDRQSVETVPDPNDDLHREPLVARFAVRGPPRESTFTFMLANVHTDPDEVDWEMEALADVFTWLKQNRYREDDIILLGDFNAAPDEFGPIADDRAVSWAISGTTTNTRRSKLYDNLIFDSQRTTEYAGRSGVFDIEAAYGLSREQALLVSDHLPVWAEFSIYEGGAPPIAVLPDASGGVRR